MENMIKSEKTWNAETPRQIRGFRYNEEIGKLGGKFYESGGRRFESVRAYHSKIKGGYGRVAVTPFFLLLACDK